MCWCYTSDIGWNRSCLLFNPISAYFVCQLRKFLKQMFYIKFSFTTAPHALDSYWMFYGVEKYVSDGTLGHWYLNVCMRCSKTCLQRPPCCFVIIIAQVVDRFYCTCLTEPEYKDILTVQFGIWAQWYICMYIYIHVCIYMFIYVCILNARIYYKYIDVYKLIKNIRLFYVACRFVLPTGTCI